MRKMNFFIFLLVFAPVLAVDSNMNKGGVPYDISNREGAIGNWKGTKGNYSTDFQSNVEGKVEHFDVYGEVQTSYSQVYWTRNNPINLPPELVKRFKGKVMAITGYEVDQVTHSGPKIGSTSTGSNLGGFSCYPDCSETDKSVPIYNAYNHHYFSWLTGKDSEMYNLDKPTKIGPTSTGFKSKEGIGHSYPTSIVFKENPGGEFRKSYHGYPSGYAQLIHSPNQWVVEPMQIDTHNRRFGINEISGMHLGPLPKTLRNNMTDLKNGLSPLIECPCTDRITKSTVKHSQIQTTGSCAAQVLTEADCQSDIEAMDIKVANFTVVVSNKSPKGCVLRPLKNGKYTAFYNTAKDSKTTCGIEENVSLQGSATLGTHVSLKIEHDKVNVKLTMSGPSDVWFGVGFDASAMADKPYAIIVDGNGGVTERKLENHSPGSLIQPGSIRVECQTVQDKVRTVVMTRPLEFIGHYNFTTKPGDVNVISAVGSTSQLSYHKARTGGKITLLPSEADSCVCQPTTSNYISYMDSSKQQFVDYACLQQPRSDMGSHGDGTGRNVPNQACHMETYHGGLQCCKHSWLLTDRDQDNLIDMDKVDTYYLKWRYYFQEYTPAVDVSFMGEVFKAPASHKHLHHWVFLIDASVNDYEEDNAEYGKASIGKITAHLKASDMGLEDLGKPGDTGPTVPNNYTTISPMVMTPHCHAPSCIREEFWNADTGEIICNVTAQYGDEKYGSTDKVFNEKDYITILPCIYGFQPGLQYPFNLTSSTNITAIKYFNNTYRHLGQMAQWTGLLVYDTDPY